MFGLARLRPRILTVIWSAMCATLTVATILWSLTLPPAKFDDGMQLTGAMLYHDGQRPNVDFYSVYPPLNSYLIGAAFRLLGESVVAYRIVQTAAYLVVVAAVAWLAARRSSGAGSKWAIAAALLLNMRLSDLQSATALMWLMLALVAVLEGTHRRGSARCGHFFAAGVCVGSLAMTRLNFALYFGVACVLDAVTVVVIDRTVEAKRVVLRDCAWMACPAVAVVAAILLLWGGPVGDLARQIIVVPSRALLDYALTPVPDHISASALFWFANTGVLAIALPIAWLATRASGEGDATWSWRLWALTAVGVLASLCVGRWRPTALPLFAAGLVIVLLFARLRLQWLKRDEWFVLLVLALQEHYTLSRPDGPHFIALFPTIAAAIAIAGPYRSGPVAMRLAATLVVVCGPAILGNVANLGRGLRARMSSIRAMGTLLRSNDEALFGPCGDACKGFCSDRDELAAASFIRQRTAPDAHVFSGLQDHSRVVVNDVNAYWLMRRPVGTRYIMMMHGVSSGAKQETEVVADLESRGVRWLLLWEGVPDAPISVDDQAEGSVLDRYIRQRFTCDARFGAYEVWQAKAP